MSGVIPGGTAPMEGYGAASANPRNRTSKITHWARGPTAMETLPRLQEVEIKSEVQRIIAELDGALSFLREADETSDKQYQRRLIRYAQIAHLAVLRLQPSLALTGPEGIRINVRLLQIRANLKRYGISVAGTLQETVVKQQNNSEKTAYLN
jgi:hypothetical protein